MTDKEKMLSGKLYSAACPELTALRKRARLLMQEFNRTTEHEREKRPKILRELLGSFGENGRINPTFLCDYGSNIFIGDDFYANYDCLILDVCRVTIGNHVLLAPRVCIFTAEHPLDAGVRGTGLESGRPITIGDNVWIGGNAVINPGVTIGRNTVIGSGSVVTKNMPENVIAVGNPCRVLREITEEDKRYWKRLRNEYYEEN